MYCRCKPPYVLHITHTLACVGLAGTKLCTLFNSILRHIGRVYSGYADTRSVRAATSILYTCTLSCTYQRTGDSLTEKSLDTKILREKAFGNSSETTDRVCPPCGSPRFSLCAALKEEGVYRINGSAKTIEKLKASFNAGTFYSTCIYVKSLGGNILQIMTF